MDSAAYFRGLLRSWWIVVIVVLAGGIGAFVVHQSTTPTYASSVTFIVAVDAPDIDELSARNLAELRAQTIASVAPTGPAVEQAVDEAGRGDDAGGVTVTASSSSAFVTITVEGPTPQTLQDVAAAYPTILPDAVDELAGPTGTRFDLNVTGPAGLPSDPVAPVLSRDLGLGLAAGLVLGLAIAVLRETLNRSIRSSDELRELTGLTVLGIVPRDLPKVLLPASTDPRSARAEAYRQVRTTLLNVSPTRPLRVAVTSATVGEGKTSVATNLAVVLSRAGHRVVVVDADLRRPRVADYFGITSEIGLTDVLAGAATLDQALVMRDDDRLGILPAGTIPANPSEALGSTAMEALLADLSAAFELVVIDTPPVLPVTDALVLGPLVDGIVLVARLGYTTRDRVARAQAGIDRVNATIFGLVPNQAGKGSDADYSYTYRSRTGDAADLTDAPVRDTSSQDPSPGGRRRADSSRPTIPVEGGSSPAGD